MYRTLKRYFKPTHSTTSVQKQENYNEDYLKQLILCNDFDKRHLYLIKEVVNSDWYKRRDSKGKCYFDHYVYGRLDDLSTCKIRNGSRRELDISYFKMIIKSTRSRLNVISK